MIKFYILFYVAFAFIIGCEKRYENDKLVRVRILHQKDQIQIHFKGKWALDTLNQVSKLPLGRFVDGDSLVIDFKENKLVWNELGSSSAKLVRLTPKDNAELIIKDVPYGVGWWWEGKENRIYQDTLWLHLNSKEGIDAVLHTPMEQYLLGVIPYEIGPDSPLEALKAQAVAARSEAVMALQSGLYSGPNHDLTSDVECQVFAGNRKRSHRSDSAVVLTKGQFLTEQSVPIHAYYASNCGGMSSSIAEVWPNRPRPASYITPLSDGINGREALDFSSEAAFLAYLNGSLDELVWCNPNRGIELPLFSQQNYRWKRSFSIEEFKAIMHERNPNMGAFLEMSIGRRGKSGRIHQLILRYENATEVVDTELAIRNIWKPALRSSAFIWLVEDEQLILKGAGWGHGVGLCQSGAIAMAKSGIGYLAILKHYYPAAETSS